MNVFWTGILKVFASMLAGIVGNVTPGIFASLKEMLTAKYVEALKTENPWDDMFLGMLLDVLAIPRPPPG